MKVTALIPDPLIRDVRKLAPGDTLTDSLLRVLSEWTAWQKSLRLADKIRKSPLTFTAAARSGKLRQQNRGR
jgi:hypothetical protein